MRLLLDTHIILWMFGNPAALSTNARVLVTDFQHDLFFSPISLFEVAIKAGKQRSDFRADPLSLRAALLQRGVLEMPLSSAQVMRISSLPSIHWDPFDRLLLSQAIEEDLMLLTVDGALLRYPTNVLDAR